MLSLSARRAWIEIPAETDKYCRYSVALRKESVDRNRGDHGHISGDEQSLSARRAWIEILMSSKARRISVSLSARRAWIEILASGRPAPAAGVALRKESVDRNDTKPSIASYRQMSLSARRAWIEIAWRAGPPRAGPVALRKESVDRNRSPPVGILNGICRSPQGERG